MTKSRLTKAKTCIGNAFRCQIETDLAMAPVISPFTGEPYMVHMRWLFSLILIMGISVNCMNSETTTSPQPDMISAGCADDDECGLGLICRGGRCRTGECNQTRTCPEGYLCDRNTNRCTAPNTSDCVTRGCPPGQICDRRNGACVPPPQRACDEGVPCERGFCVNGECREVDCIEDSHCDDQEMCNEQNRCVAIIEGCQDGDGDNYGLGEMCLGGDCDDGDASVNPGVLEDENTLCSDGVDNDCNGLDSVCGDVDGDGDGLTPGQGDCDDDDPQVNPMRAETPYNGKDDDCDPRTSDTDVDGDGYASIAVGGADCKDDDREVNPEAVEIPGDGVDNDCVGGDREQTDEDRDMDGFSELALDCNDDDPLVHPSAREVPYNGRDDDCNPATADDDLDEDGFIQALDCDDNSPDINPGAREIFYNGINDDCLDSTVDDDADGDGFTAFEVDGPDCNDRASEIHPMAMEIPYNDADDDCNPETVDDDLDGDGFLRNDENEQQRDCDDSDPDINPSVFETQEGFPPSGSETYGATFCSDGVDNNCRAGDVICNPGSEDNDDNDGDGVPADLDCDEQDPDVPAVQEIIGNQKDDDCDPDTPDLLLACQDDGFDVAASNGDASRATAVADGNSQGVQYGGLFLCPLDQDWYSITLEQGDGLEVDLYFQHAASDLDLHLFQVSENGATQLIDSSVSSNDNESVSMRTSTGQSTVYAVRVRHTELTYEPTPYSMTFNVFNRCANDLEGPDAEPNDVQASAAKLPTPGVRRQICDFDVDWYRFTVEVPDGYEAPMPETAENADDMELGAGGSESGAEDGAGGSSMAAYAGPTENVRLDLLFDHAEGDLDMSLFNETGERIGVSPSIIDNEKIEGRLEPGNYFIKVFGVQASQNDYVLLKTSGVTATEQAEMVGEVAVNDYTGLRPGRTRVDLPFTAPQGALIHSLTIRDLHLEHTWLRDLRITAAWNGVQRGVVWNLQGDNQGRDGGDDDDDLPLTGGDIDLDDRVYEGFSGLPATGLFSLEIQDLMPRDTGVLTRLFVEVQYLLP